MPRPLRFGSWSVRSILVLLIFVAIIPALGLTLGTGLQARHLAAANATEDALRLARLTASHAEDLIDGTRHLLMALVLVPDIRDGNGPACDAFLTRVLKTYPQYADASVFGSSGAVKCSTRPGNPPSGGSELAHFRRALQTQAFAIGEAHTGIERRIRILDLAYPVLDQQGRVECILSVGLKLSRLEDLVTGARLPASAAVAVFDLRGTILIRFPEPEKWVGRTIPEAAVMRASWRSMTEGVAEVPGADGVVRLYAFTSLYNDPFNAVYVAVGLSTADVFAAANRLLTLNLAGLVIAWLLALAVAWWGGGLLLGRSIDGLARAAVKVSKGDLSVRVPVTPGRGELSTLGGAFNEMTAALQARKEDAEHATRELRALSAHLEERVRERTERLAEREGELRKSERRFRSLVEHGDDAMVLLRPTGEYLYVGLNSDRVHGYTAEELMGRNVLEFTHPDDRELVKRVLAELTGRSGHVITGAFRGVHKDGSWRWFEGVASNLLDDPDVQAIVVNYRDVTERRRTGESLRESESRYRELFESANDMVFTMDVEGTLTSINSTGEQLLGYTREELLGTTFLRLIAPEEHPAALRRMAAKAAGGGPTIYESALIAKDGRRIQIEVSTKSLHRDGKPAEVLAVARDITERVRLEAQIAQSAKMASLGVMAGGIAHEVRNPLAIASAAAQLLQEQPEDERLRAEGLQKIQISIHRASLIVENLLKFAGSDSGKMQPVDVNDLVQRTLVLVEREITQNKIDLQTRFAADRPRALGNAGALEQVFTNLLFNACQAMEAGGTLTVATGTNREGEITVRVSDTGPGVRTEDLQHIFDPFFTTRPPGQGTGLGLAISYRIIEQHRGAIEAFNNAERGATFVVRLPAAADARRHAGRRRVPGKPGR